MNNLIGVWKSDPTDKATQETYGKIIMEFKNNGELIYTVYEDDKEQKIFMIYELQDNLIISDQPSHTQKEQTEYSILPNGRLELISDNIKSKYIKIS